MKRRIVDFRFYNYWLNLKQFFVLLGSNSSDQFFSAEDILDLMETIEKENNK